MIERNDYLIRTPIFLASPSDIKNERKLFNLIIDEVNVNKASSNGILLEKVVWEECLIGKGRPQEIINEEIEKCHLIVMLLWERWGSSTGKFSSGFEEEYEVAKANKKEIWFFFREIPENMQNDPGEQLRKVLDFRNKIQNEKEYLFKEYKDENDWKDKFSKSMYKWLDQKRSEDSIKSIGEHKERLEGDMGMLHPVSLVHKERKITQIIEPEHEEEPEITTKGNEGIQLEKINNLIIRKDNNNLPYLKIETKAYLGCSLFRDFLYPSKISYCFEAPQKMFVELGELENTLKIFYDTFNKSYESDNSSFMINQTCHEKQISFSWFGFGPKNFIQALREQRKRYSEVEFVRPHHREAACFIAEGPNFTFYIAFQPDVVGEKAELNFDYMQIGFIYGNMPFNTRKFSEFYKNIGFEEPHFIEEKDLHHIEQKIPINKFILKTQGFVVYKSHGEYWVSKVICENPFYNDEKIKRSLSEHKSIIVNLKDHHPLELEKKYYLNLFEIISIPYGNFPCDALRFLGNW